MNPRRLLGRLPVKLSIVAVFAVVVAALVLPGLAGALVQPVITSPGNETTNHTTRTFTFSMPASDNDEVGYELLRSAPNVPCDSTALGSATTADSDAGSAPLVPTPLTDIDSLTDGVYCYWIEATDGVTTQDSDPVVVTFDSTAPTVTFAGDPTVTGPADSLGFDIGDGTSATCAIDGGTLGSCTTATTFSFAGLTDGAHDFHVHTQDSLGNAVTADYPFTVDATPPNVTFSGPAVTGINDTLGFDPDGGTTVTCAIDGGTPGSCTTATTFSFTGLVGGGHHLNVSSTDSHGNTTNADYPFTVDATAPTIVFSIGNAATTGVSGHISFTAGDGVAVTCSTNGGTVTTSCTSPYAFSGLADGSNHVTVTSTDSHNNTASSDFTWNVDAVAPTIAFTGDPSVTGKNDSLGFDPGDGTIVTCAIDSATPVTCTTPFSFSNLTDGAHTLNVSSTDSHGNVATGAYPFTADAVAPTISFGSDPTTTGKDGTIAFDPGDGATVTCRLDSGSFATCTSPYTFSGLAAGGHTLTVHSTDAHANLATSDFAFTVDRTPPTISFTGTPTLTQKTGSVAFDAGDGVTVTCSLDSATAVACSSPFPFSNLTDGSHQLTVSSTDNHQNTATSSFTWTSDGTPPVVPSGFALTQSSPVHGTPTFSFTGSTDVRTYKLYRAGVMVNSETGTSSNLPDPTLATDGSADGTYTYTLTGTDRAGNEGAATAPITVVLDTGPPSRPANVHAAASTTNSAPVISWSASTGTPATYQISRDGSLIQTVPASITTITDPTVAIGDGFDHVYTYTVVAVDAAQNASAASADLKVTLDNTAPVPAGGLTATSPTAAKPALVWPRSASGDVTGYNVYRNGALVNGAPITGTAFTDSGLSGDGTYRYTVRSIDAAGNVSSDSIGASVVYDTTPPAAPAVTASLGTTHGTASLTWSAAADLGAGVSAYQVRRSAAGGAALTSMSEGTAICGTLPATALTCSDVGLAGGATYRYSVFAIDAVGNVSLAGQSGTISLPTSADTTPPKAPTTLHTILSGGSVTISWKNPKDDLAKVIVVWNASRTPKSATDGTSVYKGSGTKVSVKLSKLPSGKTVHFAVFALDKAGNASKATHANVSVPSQGPLSVAPGGKLSGNPKLSWKSVSTATYYNVQVFEGSGTSKRVGISWPVGTSWALPGSDLKKGKTYTWYVWPGVGAKAAAKYGSLIGKETFVYSG